MTFFLISPPRQQSQQTTAPHHCLQQKRHHFAVCRVDTNLYRRQMPYITLYKQIYVIPHVVVLQVHTSTSYNKKKTDLYQPKTTLWNRKPHHRGTKNGSTITTLYAIIGTHTTSQKNKQRNRRSIHACLLSLPQRSTAVSLRPQPSPLCSRLRRVFVHPAETPRIRTRPLPAPNRHLSSSSSTRLGNIPRRPEHSGNILRQLELTPPPLATLSLQMSL